MVNSLTSAVAKRKTIQKFVQKIRYRVKSLFGGINETPIVLLGNQKSGTSVIAHLLADYSNLSKTIDIPEMWHPTLSNLLSKRISLDKFIRKNKAAFSSAIIKEPNLTFFSDYLLKYYPKAKYVLIVRDPRDNIRSMLNRIKVPGDLKKLYMTQYPIDKKWEILFDAHVWGINAFHYIEILSERWNLVVDVYLDHANKVLLTRYEDFIADKIGMIEHLAQQLELPKANDISDKINIQYQPRGNRNVSWLEFFGAENLSRIENICGERMQKIGYLYFR